MRVVLFFILIFFIGCKVKPEFEKSKVIPAGKWNNNVVAKGDLTITNTNAFYNLFVVIRHTDAYSYNNIWLQVLFANGKNKVIDQKVEMPLANDANGWFGVGMNDIWECRHKINTNPIKFTEPGEYNFSVQQIMRDNPLLNVVSAGFRVEVANIN
jgi:gliding motility-associated lipoprotein GldH